MRIPWPKPPGSRPTTVTLFADGSISIPTVGVLAPGPENPKLGPLMLRVTLLAVISIQVPVDFSGKTVKLTIV